MNQKEGSPLISIITISYNSGMFIEETINSVISQDYTNIEYILIDGGSTDGTVDIIRTYAEKDNRIKWISEPDDGIADAFNKGLALEGGDIIGIINSDYMYCQGSLNAVADAYMANPECDVFHGDIIKVQDNISLYRLKPSNINAHIWHEMPLNHPATFVTKNAYEKVGKFNAKLKIAMDYDMVLRLYKSDFNFHYIDKVLTKMRYGGASDEEVWRGRLEIFNVTLREGYPKHKAIFWFVYKLLMSYSKNLLRKMGLYSLIRLHPKFKTIN